MKLDKIKFAMVTGFISEYHQFSEDELIELDNIIDIEVNAPVPGLANVEDVDKLMMLMLQGTQKIEAIKLYRMMTGMGLKESKDAVECYWIAKLNKEEGATISDILSKAVGK